MSEEEETEAARAEFEALSCGPKGSHVMFGGPGAAVFFQIEWDGMEPVVELARSREDIDVYCQWVMFTAGPRTACALDIGWPDLGRRRVLFFPLAEWSVELDMLRAGATLVLCPQGTNTVTALESAIGLPVDVEFLTPALMAWEILRES